jgi:hypothetical protein
MARDSKGLSKIVSVSGIGSREFKFKCKGTNE